MSTKNLQPITDRFKSNKALMIAIIIVLVILLSAGTTLVVNSQKSDDKVKDGFSAYEVAKEYGYDGTVQEWLESLKGKSAYEIAKENGYSGTEREFADVLTANSKRDAASIKNVSFNSDGKLIMILSDGRSFNVGKAVVKNGTDGKDGTKWNGWNTL